jgi:ubiquinone/menaquinone biosynthesis C-methylase UbiE
MLKISKSESVRVVNEYYEKMDCLNYNEKNLRFFKKLNEKIIVSYFKNCKKIISCGCGAGNIMWLLNQHGLNVIGFDISKDAIEYVKKKGLNGYVASIFNIPEKDCSFDGCYCWCVLEHLTEHKKALLEMNRILSPGGKLLIATELPSKNFFKKDSTHVRFFLKEELAKLLKDTGFTNIKTTKGPGYFKGISHLPHFISIPLSIIYGKIFSSIIIAYAEKPLKKV